MSRRKIERLLNLTMCLMATSRYLSVREIASLVDGYEPGDSIESEAAFRRMFERDKDELRELGVPLETGRSSSWDDEVGYRIQRRNYALPDLHLEPDEAAALGLAARLWSSASLASASESALRKLRAAGVDPQPPPAGLEPRVDVTEPAFEPCLTAVRERRRVRFAYRRPGDATPAERDVEPWGVVSWRGRWYLVGYDRGRQGPRSFRLSRVAGDVVVTDAGVTEQAPAGIDLRRYIEAAEPGDGPESLATVRVSRDAAWTLRRAAQVVEPGEDGSDILTIPFRDPERLADQIVSAGPDAVVLTPTEVRDAVQRRLAGALAAHGGMADGGVP